MKPTVEYLRECFELDEETGALTWKTRPLSHFDDVHCMNVWNARYAGSRAGSLNPSGYVQCKVRRVTIRAHVICWAIKHGAYPTMLDHIDRNPSNNAISNLRECTHAENCRNRGPRKSKIGVTGVSASRGKFTAQITVDGKRKHIGTFATAAEAHAAYCSAASETHGEFSAVSADSGNTGALGEGAEA